MTSSRADILARLQKDILALQGFKSASMEVTDEWGLGRINEAFPQGVFPYAAVHEFFSYTPEEATAARAFVSGMLSTLMRKGGVAIWIGGTQNLFPPAFKAFGLSPDQIIFLDLKKEKEIAWVMEEALKCGVLCAVVGELKEMNFTASRRFQLAIEKSRVPCFVMRHRPKNLATAAVTRWHIQPLASSNNDGLPGFGYPRWLVQLLKVRNGRPGAWQLEWVNGQFRHVSKLTVLQPTLQRRAG